MAEKVAVPGEVEDKPYEAPQSYVEAHADAAEASDLRFLHSSAAVIRMGGLPIVAIENLNISQQIARSPINVIGSIVPIAFDVQSVTVNVSGQLVQLAVMSLNNSSFYPANEAEIIANINRVFDIDVVMQDYVRTPEEVETIPFITIKNCQNTGSNITINPSTMLKDSFTAVGTIMQRDWSKLKDFNLPQ